MVECIIKSLKKTLKCLGNHSDATKRDYIPRTTLFVKYPEGWNSGTISTIEKKIKIDYIKENEQKTTIVRHET